jgi:DNA-binding NarL/FixJ family response regulator
MDGVTAIQQIRSRLPDVRILVLTTYDSDAEILPAIEAGATGYLPTDAPRDELFTVSRAAAAGRTVLSPRERRPDRLGTRDPAPGHGQQPPSSASRTARRRSRTSGASSADC